MTARLARAVPVLLAIGAVAGVLVTVNPHAVLVATQRFDRRVVIPVVLLGVAFYLLQGLRWHQLLRAVGVKERVVDSELLNLAGQSVAAVLPLGDLTRALLVSESSGVEFGAAAATVTVQELTFTLLLVLAAAPGLWHLSHGAVWMPAVIVGVAGIIAILTVQRLFDSVRRLVVRTPGIRHLLGQIEVLHAEVRHLLWRRDVLAGAVLDLGRVVVATAAIMLILRGLHIEALSWWQGTLVLAVSHLGSALSLLPGGIGANEASVVGILVVLGVNPADAAATAVLQRVSLSGVATVGGLAAYALVRHRLHLTGLGGIRRLVGSTGAHVPTPHPGAPGGATVAPVG